MVRPRDVARYAAEALDVLSSRTVQLHLNVLHNVYATAMRDELVEANPVTGAERPKAKTAAVADPRAGRRRSAVLRAFTNEHARTMFLTLVLTRLRRNELLGLRWHDVDLVRR